MVHLIHRKRVPLLHNTELILCDEGEGLVAVIKGQFNKGIMGKLPFFYKGIIGNFPIILLQNSMVKKIWSPNMVLTSKSVL